MPIIRQHCSVTRWGIAVRLQCAVLVALTQGGAPAEQGGGSGAAAAGLRVGSHRHRAAAGPQRLPSEGDAAERGKQHLKLPEIFPLHLVKPCSSLSFLSHSHFIVVTACCDLHLVIYTCRLTVS